MKNKKLVISLIIVIILLILSNVFLLLNNGNILRETNNLNGTNNGSQKSGEKVETINQDYMTDNEQQELSEEALIEFGTSGERTEIVSGEPEAEIIVKEEIKQKPSELEIPVEKEYDVIVFGAEPEGIVAAISAARNKQKVLLVEKRDGPGGIMTYSMLNTIDMSQNKERTLLSQGIFEEFFEKIGNKTSFDVEMAKKAFLEMIEAEENIETKYNVKSCSVGANEGQVDYVIIDGKKYKALSYIDCTQDADITVLAGGEYFVGWEDVNEKNRSMSATLVIHLDNVNWEKASETILREGRPNTGYTDDSIWAFGNITQNYVPTQTNMRLKALNIGRQNDGSVLINSLQIINADMLDENAKEKAYKKCVKEADHLAKFLKENIPGFENSTLIGVAPELYVRETRHIIGEYRLTVKDILESTYFTSSIATTSYPIDVQTTSIYDYGYIIGVPDQYYIPMGTIVPKGFKNLLTVGRSGSYTSIAAGSARVIPTGMTLAQSAGIMAAISKEKGINFQEMLNNYSVIKDVQIRMKMQGMYLPKESKPVIDINDRYYNYIIEMCEKGILNLGYSNTFYPEEKMSEREYIVFLQTYLKRSFLPEEFWNVEHINLLDASEKPITANRAKEIMADITTYNVKDNEKKSKIEEYINKVMPIGKEELTLVRVYEISNLIREYLKK